MEQTHTITLYSSPRKARINIVIFSVCIACCIALFVVHFLVLPFKPVYFVSVLVLTHFLLGLSICWYAWLRRAGRPRPALVIQREGIFDCSFIASAGLISWSDIADLRIEPYAAFTQHLVIIPNIPGRQFAHLSRAARLWQRLFNTNQWMNVYERALERSLEETLQTIRNYYETQVLAAPDCAPEERFLAHMLAAPQSVRDARYRVAFRKTQHFQFAAVCALVVLMLFLGEFQAELRALYADDFASDGFKVGLSIGFFLAVLIGFVIGTGVIARIWTKLASERDAALMQVYAAYIDGAEIGIERSGEADHQGVVHVRARTKH